MRRQGYFVILHLYNSCKPFWRLENGRRFTPIGEAVVRRLIEKSA